jgi:hypothetical protein
VSESLEQKLAMIPAGPNLTPADVLDTSGKFSQRVSPAKDTNSAAAKSSDD